MIAIVESLRLRWQCALAGYQPASLGCRGRLDFRRRLRPQGLHVRYPGLKLIGFLGPNGGMPSGVLYATEFGALRRIVPLRLGLEPHSGLPIGKHVALGCELGYPETVNDVAAPHAERYRPAHRHVTPLAVVRLYSG